MENKSISSSSFLFSPDQTVTTFALLSDFVKMAPFVQDAAGADVGPQTRIQSKKVTLNHDQVQKPVADDFMYDFKYNHSLPTTDVLGIDIPADCDAQKEAETIITNLSKATAEENAQAFAELFLDHGKIAHNEDPLVNFS